MIPKGDYKKVAVRSSAVLTNSYVAGTVIGPATGDKPLVHQYTQLLLYVDFTIGSLTDAQIKVEFSDDGTTYYQETYSSVSTTTSTESLGVHKLTATGLYRIAIPITDKYIKVSSVGTGTVTSSLMAIDAILAVN